MSVRHICLGVLLSLLAVGLSAPVRATQKSPVVLLVCEFGTAKSAIAREVLRKRARERGVAVIAFSRGLKIENHISAPLQAKLDADGIDPRREAPKVLTAKDIRAADIVVTFTALPTAYRPRRLLDWVELPSVNEDYAAARADLDRRIDGLIDIIAASGGEHE
jgi:protein-tyrosine-phosphatase